MATLHVIRSCANCNQCLMSDASIRNAPVVPCNDHQMVLSVALPAAKQEKFLGFIIPKEWIKKQFLQTLFSIVAVTCFAFEEKDLGKFYSLYLISNISVLYVSLCMCLRLTHMCLSRLCSNGLLIGQCLKSSGIQEELDRFEEVWTKFKNSASYHMCRVFWMFALSLLVFFDVFSFPKFITKENPVSVMLLNFDFLASFGISFVFLLWISIRHCFNCANIKQICCQSYPDGSICPKYFFVVSIFCLCSGVSIFCLWNPWYLPFSVYGSLFLHNCFILFFVKNVPSESDVLDDDDDDYI
eukprot:552198_1